MSKEEIRTMRIELRMARKISCEMCGVGEYPKDYIFRVHHLQESDDKYQQIIKILQEVET